MNTPDKLKVLAALVMVVAWNLPALAMEAPESTEAPGAAQGVEEIEILGQRSLLALRMQVDAAQEEVHLLFNELNTDDDFDIVCKVEERIFSRMRQKTCMPQYAWNAHAKQGQVFAQKVTGEAHVEGVPVDLEIDSYEPALKEQMIEAIRHSPELFDAIVKHATLMEELAEAQATYFGDDEE
jgi:hypothetical protein